MLVGAQSALGALGNFRPRMSHADVPGLCSR
jgi:hypothetical protein